MPTCTVYPELDTACQILPEVDDSLARGCFYYPGGGYTLVLGYFLTLLLDKEVLTDIDADTFPRLARVKCIVVYIAVIYIGIAQLALACSPAAVRNYTVLRSVGIVYYELRYERAVTAAEKVPALAPV